MKHKHADLIHAWADGAEIQCSFGDGEWYDIQNVPEWKDTLQYRIKPEEKEPVVRWFWSRPADGAALVTDFMYSEAEIEKGLPGGGWTKLEWSRTEFTK